MYSRLHFAIPVPANLALSVFRTRLKKPRNKCLDLHKIYGQVLNSVSNPKIIYSIDEFAEKYGMMGGLVQDPVMAILIVPKTELLIGQWQSL